LARWSQSWHFLLATVSNPPPSGSLFDVSNFIRKSAILTALSAQTCAPFG
jgi:hypothetical protein